MRRRAAATLLLGVLCLFAAVWLAQPIVALGTLALGAALAGMGALWTFQDWRRSRVSRAVVDLAGGIVRFDSLPSFITGPDGSILMRNAAARSLMPDAVTMAAVLGPTIAHAGPVLFRLATKAEAQGQASEDVVSRRGQMRLSTLVLPEDHLLWRIEDTPTRTHGTRGTIDLPMLTIGRSGAVLSANEAARRLLGDRPRTLDRVFADLPPRPGAVNRLSTVHGPQSCIVAEVEAGPGRREIYLLPAPEQTEDRTEDGLFHSLPVAMVHLDVRGRVVQANGAAQRLLGGSGGIGQPLATLMEGLGRSIGDWLADALAGRLSNKVEFLRLSGTERESFVSVALHPLRDGSEAALVAVLQDATEFKSLEAQFVQSQKMQAIGALAGGVAHDFNNLLTAIIGHCDLLLLRQDPGDPDYADLMQITQNANRAAALVGQLLAFSRKQTLRPEVLDMRDTLADLTHLLNRLVGERVQLSLLQDPALPPIRADKRQLEQVLMNLVVNARDAMPGGGEIRIETEATRLALALERDHAVVPAGEYVVVRVSDDGTGIPEALREKVFEPFFTTKGVGQGTGLGLSTAYGIVKQSGGFIFLDSEVGIGTTFTLYFPRHVAADTAMAQDDAQQGAAGSPIALPCQADPLSPRSEGAAPGYVSRPAAVPRQEAEQARERVILLVEDEAPVRAFAARALRLRGYHVVEAASAEEALAALADPSLRVDLFVTDVVMPGMDGPDWVGQALRDRPGVGVVFMSGYAEESFDAAQSDFPSSTFLPKPFSLSDLTETVRRQLH